MRRMRASSRNCRLYVHRLRILALSRKRNSGENTSTNEAGNFETAGSLNSSRSAIFRRKSMPKIMRRLRNIKNTLLYCLYTIGDIFGQTFCCIMVRRKKAVGVLKTVRI